MLLKSFFIALFLFLISITVTNAATITVSPGSSIQSAINSASPSDTISVSSGTYSERLSITKKLTVECASGTCTIKGVDVNTTGAIVKGFKITNAVGTGINTSGSGNVFENIDIVGPVAISTNSGPDADGVRFFGSGHTFRNVSITLPPAISPAHQDCFQTWGGSNAGSNTTFDGIKCYNFSIYVDSSGNHKSAGFQMENGSHDITVKNSIINAYRAFSLGDGDDTVMTNNIFVLHNVIVGKVPKPNSTYEEYGVFITKATNVTVKNNIIYNLDGSYLNGSIAADYNLIYRSDGGTTSGTHNTHDKWNIDPKFVSPSTGDYRLQSGSPACSGGESGTYMGAFACGTPSSTPAPTARSGTSTVGDLNRDGSVNVIDIGLLIDNYGKSASAYPSGDLNNDGTVNIVDVGVVISNYGK